MTNGLVCCDALVLHGELAKLGYTISDEAIGDRPGSGLCSESSGVANLAIFHGRVPPECCYVPKILGHIRCQQSDSATHLSAKCWQLTARKLEQLDSAIALEDLRIPPGNRLEALTGNGHGQHSIRINNQYRVCFVWTESGPDDVDDR